MLSNRGRAFRVLAGQIPDQNQNGDGVPLGSMVSIDSEERIVCGLALPPLPEADGAGLFLVTASQTGQVKRSAAAELQGTRSSGTVTMKLDDGDELIGAALSNGNDEYVFVASDGNAIRFREDSVRPMGLVAGGVTAIKLGQGAKAVGFGLASAGTDLVVVTQSGHGKRTKLGEYPVQGRYGVGVRTSDITERTGPVAGAWVAGDEDQATLLSAKNAALVLQAKLIGRAGRSKRGSTVMELKQGDTLASLIPLIKRVDVPESVPQPSAIETAAEPAREIRAKPLGKTDKSATPTTQSRRNGSDQQSSKSRKRRR
jgi:DNA gyrase subunit A